MKNPLNVFWDRLERHDWQFEYASGEVWRRGATENSALEMIARESPTHEKMFETFREYANNRRDRPPRRPSK